MRRICPILSYIKNIFKVAGDFLTWLQLQLKKLQFTPPDFAPKLGAVGAITHRLYVLYRGGTY